VIVDVTIYILVYTRKFLFFEVFEVKVRRSGANMMLMLTLSRLVHEAGLSDHEFSIPLVWREFAFIPQPNTIRKASLSSSFLNKALGGSKTRNIIIIVQQSAAPFPRTLVVFDR
jgi:hypothetical protein